MIEHSDCEHFSSSHIAQSLHYVGAPLMQLFQQEALDRIQTVSIRGLGKSNHTVLYKHSATVILIRRSLSVSTYCFWLLGNC